MERAKCVICVFVFIATLSFASTAYALYPTATPWSMYRHDTRHTGSTPSDAPNSNFTLWTYGVSTAGLVTQPTPLVVDGRVIFEARQTVYAVDETTGVKLWQYQAPGLLTPGTYADGRIFFGLSDWAGGVVCVNASSGVEIWNQTTSPYFVKNSPLVYNGIVYVGTTGNYTRAFNATTGQYKWGYQTNGPVYSSPAADGDLLFFGSDDANLYALNISGSTPVLAWNFTAEGAVRSTPAIDSGRVFFGSDNSKLYALNATTGKLIWSWAAITPSNIRNGVAVANGIVYVTPFSTSGLSWPMGKIHALRADVAPGNYTEGDSEILYWTWDFDSYDFNEPVYAGGKIIVTATRGDPASIYALDADVGTVLWTRIVGWWPALGSPVVADGRMWFTACWGEPVTLYCIGDPFPPKTEIYTVTAGGQSFDVTIVTNSTVSDFNTTNLLTGKMISYKVEGIAGTTGMSNITIPNEMLGGPYIATVDDGAPWYIAPAVNNGTHTSLFFTYNSTGIRTIVITGTTIIPEFPTAIILPLFTALATLTAIYLRKRLLRRQ